MSAFTETAHRLACGRVRPRSPGDPDDRLPIAAIGVVLGTSLLAYGSFPIRTLFAAVLLTCASAGAGVALRNHILSPQIRNLVFNLPCSEALAFRHVVTAWLRRKYLWWLAPLLIFSLGVPFSGGPWVTGLFVGVLESLAFMSVALILAAFTGSPFGTLVFVPLILAYGTSFLCEHPHTAALFQKCFVVLTPAGWAQWALSDFPGSAYTLNGASATVGLVAAVPLALRRLRTRFETPLLREMAPPRQNRPPRISVSSRRLEHRPGRRPGLRELTPQIDRSRAIARARAVFSQPSHSFRHVDRLERRVLQGLSKEKTNLLGFLLRRAPAWSRRWQSAVSFALFSVAVAAVAAFTLSVCPMSGAAQGWVRSCAFYLTLLLPAAPLLLLGGGKWGALAAYTQGHRVVPLLAFHPIDFREVFSLRLRVCNTLLLAWLSVAIPATLTASLLLQVPLPEAALALAKWTGLFVCLQLWGTVEILTSWTNTHAVQILLMLPLFSAAVILGLGGLFAIDETGATVPIAITYLITFVTILLYRQAAIFTVRRRLALTFPNRRTSAHTLPPSVSALCRLSNLVWSIGLRRLSCAVTDLLTRLHPDNIQLLAILGWRRVMMKRNSQAKTVLRLALELDDTNVSSWEILAAVHAEEKMWRRADNALTRAISLSPTNPNLWLARSRALFHMRYYEAAAECASMALDMKADHVEAHRQLVTCLAMLGNVDDVRAAGIAELVPYALYAAGRSADLLRLMEEYATCGQEVSPLIRAFTRESVLDFDGALADLREAERQRTSRRAPYFIAAVHLAMGRYEEARDAFHQLCVETEPSLVDAMYTRIMLRAACLLLHQPDDMRPSLADMAAHMAAELPPEDRTPADECALRTAAWFDGRLDDDTLLRAAFDNGDVTEAHTWFGIRALVAERTDDARSHFEAVRDVGQINSVEYPVALALLSRLPA